MGKRRGLSAERIARRMLEGKGFSIVARHHQVESEGEVIAEVDMIAEKDGRYAVEVKSGRANLDAVRQAYANAHLLGYRPLLICKKADDAVRQSAHDLGVELLEFSEYHLLLEPEELETIVRQTMEETLESYGLLPLTTPVEEPDLQVLQALQEAERFSAAAERLGLSPDALGRRLSEMAGRGILPARSLSFSDLKRCSAAILARHHLWERLAAIERALTDLQTLLSEDR